MDPIRVAEHLHGHLGWLAATALVHPAIVLRHAKRRAHLAVGLAVAVASATGALRAEAGTALAMRRFAHRAFVAAAALAIATAALGTAVASYSSF